MQTSRRGEEGEDLAAAFLQAAGYHIVKRNLRCRSGEVDIVVYRDDNLVFIEVKHWLTIPIHDLERSITAAKRKRILGCARLFQQENAEWRPFQPRFDIIWVGPEQILHFEHAFTESGFQ